MYLSSLEEALEAGDGEGLLFNTGGFGREGAETVFDGGFLMEIEMSGLRSLSGGLRESVSGTGEVWYWAQDRECWRRCLLIE